MDSGRPLVSVLTPSFNQARWLGQALESVARQTYRPIEHVVVDGDSTDGTLGLLENASSSVRWSSEPDRGQSEALNKAFVASSGEIIGWINSDDAYYDTRAVAAAVETFVASPEVDLVYGHAVLVNPAGRILHPLWVPPPSLRLLRLFNYIIQPSVFIRRRALSGRFVDETYESMMDRELWLRLSTCCSFKRLPMIVSIDRHYPERKALARKDLARQDERRLTAQYGLPSGAAFRAARKAYKAASRLRGTSLVLTLGDRVAACEVTADSAPRMLARQVAVPRRWMPLDRNVGAV